MDLARAALEAKRLGQVAFVATTRPDARPHALPVLVAWQEDAVERTGIYWLQKAGHGGSTKPKPLHLRPQIKV